MELTIDQALQRGVNAHRNSEFKEAERLYRAILQVQPNHSDANHNLGVLIVAVGKVADALPLFKTALEAKPNVEQYWLSYIDALINENKCEEAQRVIADGKRSGINSTKLRALESRLPSPLRETVPPPSLIDNALKLYQDGHLTEAEDSARSLTQEFPNHLFGWTLLGAILNKTNQLHESMAAMQKCIQLAPTDPAAFNNLGSTLRRLGKLEKALVSLRQAIKINPRFAEAHNNLGNTLRQLGRLEESEASFRQALELNRSYAKAYNNLGLTLQQAGRIEEAQVSFKQALTHEPDYQEAHVNMGQALSAQGDLQQALEFFKGALSIGPGDDYAYRVIAGVLKTSRFNKCDRSLYPLLRDVLLSGNYVRPKKLATAILDLLSHDELIIQLLDDNSAGVSTGTTISAIETLHSLPILHDLMRISPLPDLPLDRLFTSMRRTLLLNIGELEQTDRLLQFQETLALHCFTNEYVYYEAADEMSHINALEHRITECISLGGEPKISDVLCLASYRALHKYGWCESIQIVNQLPEVKRRLIEEPREENLIASNIPFLQDTNNQISIKVRKQYEENPYPRWIKFSGGLKNISVIEFVSDVGLRLKDKNILAIDSPEILIAGCGTGQQSLEIGCCFSNCEVLSVDLSTRSLAYAKRKADEIGAKNLHFLRADILDLERLGRQFDIIECSGVLHHMDDPIEGWRVLVRLLRTGGLLNIGLYSDLARRHVTQVREEVAALGVGASESEIRNVRHLITQSQQTQHKRLLEWGDFFDLSSVRDLLFHVQEHRFTIPQIQKYLTDLKLEFCGFESKEIISKFERFHGENSDIRDLSLWALYEENDPLVFSGMYQFWCQKI